MLAFNVSPKQSEEEMVFFIGERARNGWLEKTIKTNGASYSCILGVIDVS